MRRAGRLASALLILAGAAPGVPWAQAAPAGRAAPATQGAPGAITLSVDASDVERRIFRVRESLPVVPGPYVLRYPEWLPGKHAPRGPIDALVGLTMSAAGHRLEWERSATSVYEFRTTIPAGATQLDLEFQFTSPLLPEQGRIMVTPEIIGLQWTAVLLYPAGPPLTAIPVDARVQLPPEWDFGCALEVAAREGAKVSFRRTDLDTLTDSPLLAGRWFQRLDLDPGAAIPVHLDVAADSAALINVRPEQLAAHRSLVQQTYALLGAPHYDHYDMLLAISEGFGEIGLEHLRSSENREPPGYFTEWDRRGATRMLLPHELAHSWNGKYRRPAGLATPDFSVPSSNDLLWVYEGLTTYLETVLAARSGLWTSEFARQEIAYVAAIMERDRPGRSWRNLQDTTLQPIITPRRPLSWVSWERGEDYYPEGLLLWLEVDARIREISNDKRSLDDFARAFFQAGAGAPAPVTYTLEELVHALESVAPYDWAGFFAQRLHAVGEHAPLEGLAHAGWELVWVETPTEYVRSLEEEHGAGDFLFSLGLHVRQSGQITEVRWGSVAHEAGITLGGQIIAVNGREFRPERLREAIATAARARTPLELIVKSQDRYRTVQLPYFEGPRYPLLRRVDRARDRLSRILQPRS